MENSLVLLVGSGLLLTAVTLLDRAWLKKHPITVLAENKRIAYLITTDWGVGCSVYRSFIIDFELDSEKYSTSVSSELYEKIEKGAVVYLECGKSRLTGSMIFEISRNQNALNAI